MRFGLKFRTLKFDVDGLTYAHKYFEQEIKKALDIIGGAYRFNFHYRMREDTGISKRSIMKYITGRGINQRLRVETSHIRAIVDNFGIRPGNIFPNWRPGGPLFKWAYRKVRRNEYGKPKSSQRPNFLFKVKKAKRVPKVKHRTWQSYTKHSGWSHKNKRFNSNAKNWYDRYEPKYSKPWTGIGKGRSGNSIRVSQFFEAKRFAYLVARKIYFKGVKPTYWLRETIREQRTGRAGSKDISTLIWGIEFAVERINNKGQTLTAQRLAEWGKLYADYNKSRSGK